MDMPNLLCLVALASTAAEPWMDTSQTPKERATSLLAEMTFQEKIQQVTCVTCVRLINPSRMVILWPASLPPPPHLLKRCYALEEEQPEPNTC